MIVNKEEEMYNISIINEQYVHSITEGKFDKCLYWLLIFIVR